MANVEDWYSNTTKVPSSGKKEEITLDWGQFERAEKLMIMPGATELLIVLAIVLVVFGAGRLPGIGDALGRSIKNFKRSVSGKNEIEVGDQKSIGSGAKAELEEGEIVKSEE